MVRHSKSVIDKRTQVSRVLFHRMVFYLWLFLGETDSYISFLLLESSPIAQNQVTNDQGCYVVLLCCFAMLFLLGFIGKFTRIHVHVYMYNAIQLIKDSPSGICIWVFVMLYRS